MEQNNFKKLNIEELEQVKGGLIDPYIPPKNSFLYESYMAKYGNDNQNPRSN